MSAGSADVKSHDVVFIHGMWADSRHWNRFRRAFDRAGFCTQAVTLPFHDTPQEVQGLSNIGILDYVDMVRGELDSRPVVLVGHSMGGLVAQKLAESENVRALVLLATCAPAGIRPLTPSSALCISRNVVDIVLGRPFIIPQWNASYGLTNALSSRERKVVQESFLYESGRALREIVLARIPVDERKVRCPVLVGVGSLDRATPRSVARRVARKYRADYHEYSGRCHFLGGDSEVIADVLAWCSAVTP